MIKNIVCLSIGLLTLLGCQSQRASAKANQPILDSKQVRLTPAATTPTDEQLRFDMKKGEVVGDSLVLKVKYGGGCGKHVFSLTTPEDQTGVWQVWLMHDVTDDPCRAFVIKELKFDLSPMREQSKSPIVFRLNNEPEEYTYTW